MAVLVQDGGRLSLARTTLATEGEQGGMLHVDTGGSVTAEDCTLRSAGGADSPFPCDGDLPICLAPHEGSVELPGVAEVRTESPLVCDAATGHCDSVTCPPLMHPVSNTTDGFVYDNPGRTFGTRASCAEGYAALVGNEWDGGWTCQINGTWSGVAGSLLKGGDLCAKYGIASTCDDQDDQDTCIACCRFREPCTPTEGGLLPIVQWAQQNGGMTREADNQVSVTGGSVHTACLTGDVATALAAPPPTQNNCCERPSTRSNDFCDKMRNEVRTGVQTENQHVVPASPTIRVSTGMGSRSGEDDMYPLELTIDCAKTSGPCRMRDRLEIGADNTGSRYAGTGAHMYINRLHFANLFANTDLMDRWGEGCRLSNFRAYGFGGGAVHLGSGSVLTAVSCMFTENVAGPNGGAIESEGSAILNVIACQFTGNRAQIGGAVSIRATSNSDPALGLLLAVSCIFEHNVAMPYCTPELGNGGAINIDASRSDLVISSCTFEANLGQSQVYIQQEYQHSSNNVPTLTLNATTFTTDFMQSCAELSSEYAERSETCGKIKTCQEQNEFSTCHQFISKTEDMFCCKNELTAQTIISADIDCADQRRNGQRCSDRHALQWNSRHTADLQDQDGVHTGTYKGEPLPFNEAWQVYNDAMAMAAQPIEHDNGKDCCSVLCRAHPDISYCNSRSYGQCWPTRQNGCDACNAC
jgi:hypothetical protein